MQVMRVLKPPVRAILLYYGLQAITIVVLILLAAQVHRTPAYIFGHWDSAWFSEVAEHGYRIPVIADQHGTPGVNPLVFFPLYPAMLTPLVVVGVPTVLAGVLISLIAGGFAAWGLFTLGRELSGPRVGTMLAALWAIAPGASALHLVYSEALLAALAAWALVAVLRRQWLLAAGLTIAAGLTRAAAVALVAAVVVAAIVA